MVWPLPRPWSETMVSIPSNHCKPYAGRIFRIWSAASFLDLVSQTLLPRGGSRPLSAEESMSEYEFIAAAPSVYTFGQTSQNFQMSSEKAPKRQSAITSLFCILLGMFCCFQLFALSFFCPPCHAVCLSPSCVHRMSGPPRKKISIYTHTYTL